MRSDVFDGAAHDGAKSPRPPHVETGTFREFDIDVAHLERAAVQRLRGREVHFSKSAVALSIADRVTMRQSTSIVVAGRSVAADEVRSAFVIAPVVRGNVQAWIDLRTAIGIGVGMGLAKAAISGLRALGRRLY